MTDKALILKKSRRSCCKQEKKRKKSFQLKFEVKTGDNFKNRYKILKLENLSNQRPTKYCAIFLNIWR